MDPTPARVLCNYKEQSGQPLPCLCSTQEWCRLGVPWLSSGWTWHFHCRGLGLIPGQGTKIQQATWHGQIKRMLWFETPTIVAN